MQALHPVDIASALVSISRSTIIVIDVHRYASFTSWPDVFPSLNGQSLGHIVGPVFLRFDDYREAADAFTRCITECVQYDDDQLTGTMTIVAMPQTEEDVLKISVIAWELLDDICPVYDRVSGTWNQMSVWDIAEPD